MTPFRPKGVIIGVFAETYQGNDLIWVIRRDSVTGELSQESIQPEEQSPVMMAIHEICVAAHECLMRAVCDHCGETMT